MQHANCNLRYGTIALLLNLNLHFAIPTSRVVPLTPALSPEDGGEGARCSTQVLDQAHQRQEQRDDDEPDRSA
jgi:hypothetical protein